MHTHSYTSMHIHVHCVHMHTCPHTHTHTRIHPHKHTSLCKTQKNEILGLGVWKGIKRRFFPRICQLIGYKMNSLKFICTTCY